MDTEYQKTQFMIAQPDPYGALKGRSSGSYFADCDLLIYNNPLANHIIKTINQRQQNLPLDSTDSMFEDRLSLIRSKLELIILQVGERKNIHRKILYQIDKDGCEVQNLYFELPSQAYGLCSEKLTLNKIKLDLERQRRIEQSAYFNDTAMLNRELKDTLIQYMDEIQKNQMLTEEDPL